MVLLTHPLLGMPSPPLGLSAQLRPTPSPSWTISIQDHTLLVIFS